MVHKCIPVSFSLVSIRCKKVCKTVYLSIQHMYTYFVSTYLHAFTVMTLICSINHDTIINKKCLKFKFVFYKQIFVILYLCLYKLQIFNKHTYLVYYAWLGTLLYLFLWVIKYILKNTFLAIGRYILTNTKCNYLLKKLPYHILGMFPTFLKLRKIIICFIAVLKDGIVIF